MIRILRHLLPVIVACSCALPALGCDLLAHKRGTQVANFVEMARPCVDALPEGYTADLDMEAEFLTLINAARREHGLTELVQRPRLLRAARFHSLDMAVNNYFSHEGPRGRLHAERIAALDRRAVLSFSAENIAMIEIVRGPYDLEQTVPQLHQGLMDSPGHRDNILSERATHIALGVIRSDQGVWVTQVFAQLSGEMPSDVPVRVRAGDVIGRLPELSEWTAKRLEVSGVHGAYEPLSRFGSSFMADASRRGDYDLSIYGERAGPVPNSKQFTRLMGPALTME